MCGVTIVLVVVEEVTDWVALGNVDSNSSRRA